MLTLRAQTRKLLGRKTKQLRKEDLIPAVIYGHNIKTKPIQVDLKTFSKVFKEAGESSLVNLEIDKEKPTSVLIHDLSYHPLTSKIIHIDFYQVKAHEKLTTDVELKFIGESPAVKNLGGILVTHLKRVKIECLPQDLIHEIEVDFSQLTSYGDEIKIKDLKVPERIRILEDGELIVVNIEEPAKEEEVVKEEVAAPEAEAGTVAAEKPEVLVGKPEKAEKKVFEKKVEK